MGVGLGESGGLGQRSVLFGRLEGRALLLWLEMRRSGDVHGWACGLGWFEGAGVFVVAWCFERLC